MRPIDADKIPWLNYPPHVEGFQTVTKTAIDKMPTVVAEPVIRCKDCKYWGADSYRYGCKYATGVMFENDYCSRAERRDDA